MFALTVLAYPAVLVLLVVGAGLAVDGACGRRMPAALVGAVGLAAAVATSQLGSYVSPLAPAVPYLLVALAVTGWVTGHRRVRAALRNVRSNAWPLAVGPIAYLIALAPVLASGRATLSSYMALTDSAFHILGASYFHSHGQSFAHLNLASSAGQYMNNYYAHGYPSGADTLFGATASLVGASLLFAYQPYCALALAVSTGPAWLIARRLGLGGAWAALAAVAATLPALVYGYELVGSVKELVALPELMALGAFVACRQRWLAAPARGTVPAALVVAAGVSAIGISFGAWALASALVLGGLALADARAAHSRASDAVAELGHGGQADADPSVAGQARFAQERIRRLAAAGGAAAVVVAVAALPTWAHLGSSLKVAQAIATTGNPGNIHHPLRITQALGVWLNSTYLVEPSGTAFWLTQACLVVTAAALAGGAWRLLTHQRALAGWVAAMLVVWVVLTVSGTTWTNAKTLMLTSPIVVLVAWAGVAALRARAPVAVAALLAAVLIGEVAASDALQYHSSNLAPTARYQELAALDKRFAGRGPALFTQYDEYAMYELRDLDIAAPNFIYVPPQLSGVVARHGDPVALDRIAPATLARYPLIVTRTDPRMTRPPSAYTLAWQGTYYQVWQRRRSAPAAIAVRIPAAADAPATATRAVTATRGAAPATVAAAGARDARDTASCTAVREAAAAAKRWAAARDGSAASAAATVAVARSQRLIFAGPPHLLPGTQWKYRSFGLELAGPGAARMTLTVPRAGTWHLWVQGQLMPAVTIAVDERSAGIISGQVEGGSLSAQAIAPLSVELSAGRHTISIVRGATGLGPGEGGWADVRAVFLTPAAASGRPEIVRAPLSRWHSLCGAPVQWAEALPG
jgi:hypothetical protein